MNETLNHHAALCAYWHTGGADCNCALQEPRATEQSAFATWRTRALAAERRVEALAALVEEAMSDPVLRGGPLDAWARERLAAILAPAASPAPVATCVACDGKRVVVDTFDGGYPPDERPCPLCAAPPPATPVVAENATTAAAPTVAESATVAAFDIHDAAERVLRALCGAELLLRFRADDDNVADAREVIAAALRQAAAREGA